MKLMHKSHISLVQHEKLYTYIISIFYYYLSCNEFFHLGNHDMLRKCVVGHTVGAFANMLRVFKAHPPPPTAKKLIKNTHTKK